MLIARFVRRSAPERADRRARRLAAALGVIALLAAPVAGRVQDVEKPAAPQPAAPQPAAPPKPAAKPAAKPAPALTLSVEVTDQAGGPVPDVAVAVAGPVERSGTTTEKGAVVFRTMRPGSYRLRFEREGFVTLERDVVLRAGQPASASVALSPAPPPPPPPEPPPAPDPPEPAARTPREVAPRALSIPDFLDKNLIGGEPQRTTVLGCAEGGTARLLQIRDPLEDREHADVDELIYVVAGAGTLRIGAQETKLAAGFFALVPRGHVHSLRRQGRTPLVAVSVLAGAPCEEGR